MVPVESEMKKSASLCLDEVELIHVKRPLRHPFRISAATVNEREFVILRGRADGLTVYSEANIDATPFYTGETIKTVWHICKDVLLPRVLGKSFESIDQVRKTWEKVRGHEFAKAAIEHLYWDLQGKIENRSIKQLLGGVDEYVEMGTSHSIFPTLDELLEDIQHALDAGIRRIKIKIMPGWDHVPLAAVRKHFGDMPLMVDANAAYDLQTHKQLLCDLDQYGLIMIEQPLQEGDLVDHAELAREMKTKLCLDESAHGLHDVASALKLKSAAIINIKVGRVGGLTVSKQIHDHCHERHVPLWVGRRTGSLITVASELAVQSLPGCSYPSDLAYDLFQEPLDHVVDMEQFEIQGYRVKVPDGPGIGVTVNEKTLNKITVSRELIRLQGV